MTILIGYGTPKKWKGRTMDIYPNSEYDNPNFLWDFDYDFIENMINKGKKETNLKNGIKLVPIYEKAEKQNSNASSLIAFIYDYNHKIHILSSRIKSDKINSGYSWDLIDTYDLRNNKPNWEKIHKIKNMIWDYRWKQLRLKAK